MNISLYTYFTSVSEVDLCILSSDEYELGETKCNCSSENENYFVSEDDYITLNAE